MRFDPGFDAALQAVAAERSLFRSALAATLEQVRAMMASVSNGDRNQERLGAELGAFAQGRIQMDRFSEIARPDIHYKKSLLSSIRHAQQILTATLALGDRLFCVEVEQNGDCYKTVDEALATSGRAFAAAYLVELIRAGREHHPNDQTLLGPMAPDRWTRAERLVAPPLVVRVSGNDLRVGGMEELLQGNQKIVLLVEGLAPPAALVRLISPGVFVTQCRSVGDLGRFTSAQGPAIAAVMNEPAAVFTYERGQLDVSFLPAEAPRRPLRCSTAFRQREDLAWLQQLQQLHGALAAEASEQAAETVEPGDKLAAWLLRQIEMPNP
jgi:hypothetical protein